MDNAPVRKWWIFFGASLMILLANVDATIVNLALATIARDLNTDLIQIQWVINSYLLTAMIFFIIGGKLSDVIGRKKVFLLGAILFGISSLIAGLTSSFSTLIIARLAQGIGFAFTLSLAMLIITNVFPESRKGFVLGLAITITGIGQALGPTIGGVILEKLNWHWIFLINVPIAALSFALVYLFVKPVDRNHQPIDYIGSLIMAAALTIMLLTFNTVSHPNFNLKLFILGIFVTIFLFVIFYFKERKTKFPLVDFSLFKRRDYTFSILIRLFMMYIYGTFLFYFPLYMQNGLGFSPLLSGLLILVSSAFFAICSPFSGIWSNVVGYKTPLIFASVTCLFSYFIFSFLGAAPSEFVLLFGLIFFGCSAGIIIPTTVHSTLSSIPLEKAGEGLGMFFTVAFAGLSLGVAISGAQVNLVSTYHLFTVHHNVLATLNKSTLEMLHRVASGTLPATKLKPLLSADSYKVIGAIAKHSFIKGFVTVMWLNVLLSAIMMFLCFALKRRPFNG